MPPPDYTKLAQSHRPSSKPAVSAGPDYAKLAREHQAAKAPPVPTAEAAIGENFPFETTQRAAQIAIDLLDSTTLDDLKAQFEGAKDAQSYDAKVGLQRAEQKAESFYRGLDSTAAALQAQAQQLAATDPVKAKAAMDLSAKLMASVESHKAGEMTPTRAAAKAKGLAVKGLNAAQNVLDTHRLTRNLTGDALDPARKADAPIMSDEEWTRRMKEQFPTAANIAGATLGLPITVGAGVLASALAGGVDLATWAKEKQAGIPEDQRTPVFSGEGFKDIWKGTFEAGKDFGLHMATDVTTPLTLMGGTVAKNAGRQIGLLGKAAGKSPAEISAAISDVEKILKGANPTKVVGGMSEGTFEALAHLEDLGFAGASKAFGTNAERFGKGGIGYGIPGTDKKVELSQIVGAVSPRAGLALEAPITRGLSAVDSALKTNMVTPAGEALRTMQQRAQGMREEAVNVLDTRTMKLLEEKAAAGLDAKTFDEYVRNTLDPGWELKELNGAPTPGAVLFENVGGKLKRLNGAPPPGAEVWEAVPGPNYVPITARSPEIQAFDTAYRELMDQNFNLLERAGVLKPGSKAGNLITGAYVPRQYGRLYGALDELNTGPGGHMGGANAFNKRTGMFGEGEPLGGARAYSGPEPKLTVPGNLVGKLQAETNLANALPVYNRQAANSIAKESMFRELRASGLAVKSSADEVKKSPHLFHDIGGGYHLDANAYKFVADVFENKPITLAGIARDYGKLGTSGPGRAVIAMLETAGKLEQQWKRVTLTHRFGYHTLNAVNDLQYLMAMGARPNDLWLAAKAMKGKGPAVAAARRARRYGIGVSTAARTEQLGGGVAQAQRAANRLAKGKAAKSRTERLVDLPQEFGDWWGDTARLAGFIARERQGDTAAKAAAAVRRGMIDYSTSPKWLQALRFLMPFATFQARAPLAAARHLATSPRTVIGSMRAAQALGGQRKEGVEPRQYVADRGQLVPLGDTATGYYNKARALFGAPPVAPEEQAFVNVRDAFQDPFTMPVMSAGHMSADPLINSLNPGARFALEALSGRNILVDKQLKGTFAPMNPGVPAWAGAAQGGVAGLLAGKDWRSAGLGALAGGALAAGDWAEADPTAHKGPTRADQVGWFQHYLGGLAPSWANTALNQAAREGVGPLEGMGAQLGPPSPMSSWRAYDSAGDPRAVTAGQFISSTTGFPVYTASPVDRLYNTTSSEAFDKGLSANEAIAELLRKYEALLARSQTR